jgi:hypothetical protein
MTDVRADVEAAILDPCVCGGRDNPDCERCVLVAVARAWLAANPADSDEPVDPEFLRSLGFAADGAHVARFGWGPDSNGSIQVYPNGVWFLNGTRAKAPATRGDVRRLLAALGIS